MLFKSWKQQIMQITNLPHMWGIILLYIFGYFNKMNLKCSCYEIKGQPNEFATLSSFKFENQTQGSWIQVNQSQHVIQTNYE